MKKVYFAGSIRGGRADAGLYQKMIEHIKSRGNRVLTEHVGNLSLSLKETHAGGDVSIYDQDTAWLRECDFLIAECTCPSLGVGYELAYAERFQKPVCIFYRGQEVSLSAMLTGDPYYRIISYENEEDLLRSLDEVLDQYSA
jgi:hypothetical protein